MAFHMALENTFLFVGRMTRGTLIWPSFGMNLDMILERTVFRVCLEAYGTLVRLPIMESLDMEMEFSRLSKYFTALGTDVGFLSTASSFNSPVTNLGF